MSQGADRWTRRRRRSQRRDHAWGDCPAKMARRARRTSSAGSTPIGGRPTTSLGRADLPARQPAPEGAPEAGAHHAAAARPPGHVARPEHALRPPQPGHQAGRPGRNFVTWPGSLAACRWSPTPTWRGPAARLHPRSATPRGGGGCSSSSADHGHPHVALEYSRGHPRGASQVRPEPRLRASAFDNLDLIVACVYGDGGDRPAPPPAGTATSSSTRPATCAVLPILGTWNGYKIANPCFLARIPKEELQKFFEGMGWQAMYFVEGHDPTGGPPAARRGRSTRSWRRFGRSRTTPDATGSSSVRPGR